MASETIMKILYDCKKCDMMQNITIYIPEIYDDNIKTLKNNGIVRSRSAAIRTAIKEFLMQEFGENLKLLNFKSKVISFENCNH
jgi:metal-responsive CopG/Arc/MetJ family transcriptional regulator